MKTRSRKAVVAALDKAFGDYIKARDGKCIVCGTRENLTCGHLFTRSAYSTRWDPLNAYGQCLSHNLRHEYDYYPMHNAVLAKIGPEKMADLYVKHHTVAKYKTFELEGMIEHFKALKSALADTSVGEVG